MPQAAPEAAAALPALCWCQTQGQLWNIGQGTAVGVEMGGSKALTALGTHEEDEDARASFWNTTERTWGARLHQELLLAQHHGGASQSLGSLFV